MAVDDKEIEVKVKLENEEQFLVLKEKIESIAAFKKESFQIDEYFTPEANDFFNEAFPFEWLSIRSRNGRTLLNYKHFYPEGAEKHDYCDEYELTVSSAEMMKKILNSLGILTKVTVEKSRLVYMYKDEFEIALDTVKNLGFFVEIEAIKDFGDVKTTREKIHAFMNSLDINSRNIDYRGYPFQLLHGLHNESN